MKYQKTAGQLLAVISTMAIVAAAQADGQPPAGGAQAAPAAAEERKFNWSWNLGVASDYIFRGISQNARRPAPQAGVDFTAGILYAGLWGSDVNFGRNLDGSAVANAEIDLYVGIKPVFGPLTLDLGFIAYSYHGGNDGGPTFGQVREQDYVEVKFGASAQLMPNFTAGLTAFYSPQYTGGQGEVITLEGTAAYELPKVLGIVPTVGGTLAGVFGDANDTKDPFISANGKDSYMYWNAGLLLGIDKLSVDLRYWDTNIPNSGRILANGFCTGRFFGCDNRFIATVKVTY